MTEGAASCGALSSHARPLISLIQKAAAQSDANSGRAIQTGLW